jgi:hypothetical protein
MSLVSDRGSGGGRCFSNGLCQFYEQVPGGHAFATTLSKDSANRMRLLVTELDAGKAVRFYEETIAHL